jgi:hypothetical protein
VPRTVLAKLIRGPLYGSGRFVRPAKGPYRYSVADAKVAIEPHRSAIAERARRAAEGQAQEQAAALSRREAKAAAPVTTRQKPARAASVQTPRRSSGAPVVEVVVRRRPGAA